MIDTTTFASLHIEQMSMDCPTAMMRQQLRDGTVVDSSVGADLWQGEFSLAAAYHPDQAQAEAALRRASRVGNFILGYDARRVGPAWDPDGLILTGFTPKIGILDANNRQMRINGMPGGYVLTRGDYIGWLYSGRYALHQIMDTVTVDGSGLSPLFEVDPHIRPGATVNTPVSLVRPAAKFRITELSMGTATRIISRGPTFSMIQTLGA